MHNKLKLRVSNWFSHGASIGGKIKANTFQLQAYRCPGVGTISGLFNKFSTMFPSLVQGKILEIGRNFRSK